MDSKNNTGVENTGDGNSGYWNSGNRNSGNKNSGYGNSGNRNSGNWNSGDFNSGHWNSGQWNSGNWNSGFFNSDTPNVRIFNKETGIKRENLYIPYIDLKITEWVPEENMTDQEKKDNPKFFITKGYLKKREYKEVFALYWKNASDMDKQAFKNLPNFDAVIFYDITGIDLSVDTDKMKKEMIAEAEDLMKKGMDLLNKAKGIC